MTVRILQGDCRDVLATLDADSIDACVTDPPYELTTSKKGGRGLASVSLATPHGRARVTTGFMGMTWDGNGAAFDVETWRQLLRVLKPGAHVVAFGGSRTYHRLVCAVEDAGFEIRDQLAWLYGNGFPKGTDKAKIPAAWQGWNTALKPAHEPIVLARKPMIGTLAENLERFGTGALWIDGCRIDLDGETTERKEGGRGQFPHEDDAWVPKTVTVGSAAGRWPANLLHDGSDEVLQVFPEAGAAAPVHRRNSDKFRTTFGSFKGDVDEQGSTFRGDKGSAARFFYCPKATRADRNDGLQGMPEKALRWSSGDQSPGAFQLPNTNRNAANHHPTVKPTDVMRWLCRLVTPPGGLLVDPFMGSGSTLKAAELEGFASVGIELDADYIAIARRRIGSDAPLFAEVA